MVPESGVSGAVSVDYGERDGARWRGRGGTAGGKVCVVIRSQDSVY